jgi:hypothetical protein
VTPVAGGVADAEQDGLVLAARLFDGLVAPRIPVHRVVRVLQQVRTRLVGEPVGVLVRGHMTASPSSLVVRDV